MISFLKHLSGFFFYVLGTSFFTAFLLMHNNVGGIWPAWWLQVADLPLAFSACVYGGASFLMSVKGKKPSNGLTWVVTIVCAAFFLVVLAMNFWGVY